MGYVELANDLLNKLDNKQILASGTLSWTSSGCIVQSADGIGFKPVTGNVVDFESLSEKRVGVKLPGNNRYQIDEHALRRFVTRTATIFYCWQSWSPKETNKDFILSALQSAVTEVNSRCGINLQIDSDTQGIPGSVGFSDTILKKITTCEIFVADITAVGGNHDNSKQLPNGNVMFEYGFATATHEPERIIVMHNSAFGKVEEFPSDVRHRMAIEYRCEPCTDEIERTAQLSSLRKQLVTELTQMSAGLIQD